MGDLEASLLLYAYVATLSEGLPAYAPLHLDALFHQAVIEWAPPDPRAQPLPLRSRTCICRYDGVGGAPCEPEGAMPRMLRVATAELPVGDGGSELPEETQPAALTIGLAQFNVGRAYLSGVGAKRDPDEAERWWLRAADGGEGCHQAMHSLGLLYASEREGDSVLEPLPPKLAEAFYWHGRAALKGNIASMAATGLMLKQGLGCERDPVKALEMLKPAAESGSLCAQSHLAEHYFRMRLFHKAVQWGGRVAAREPDMPKAERADLEAFALGVWILGRCHERGLGVPASRSEGARLMSLAARCDSETAYQLRSQMLEGVL